MFEPRKWLEPVQGDNPAGVELREDPRFDEIERLCQPVVDVVTDDLNNVSDSITRPPDWATVLEKAEALAESGKDLRLLVIVTRAMFELRGLAGLRDGLLLLRDTCRDFWDTAYPVLRANQPVEDAARRRMTALRQLDGRTSGLVGPLKHRTFLAQPGDDEITGEDLSRAMLSPQQAADGLPELAGDKDRQAVIHTQTQLIKRVKDALRGLARDNAEKFAALKKDATDAAVALDALETVMTEKLGEKGPIFAIPELGRILRGMNATIDGIKPAAASPTPATVPDASDQSHTADLATQAQPVAAQSAQGTIASRDDVIDALDRIIDFYKRTEPASPVPVLAQRTRNAVNKTFVELLEDMAPGGLKDFNAIIGPSVDSKGKIS
ncbi:MAG: type VI secretion system protein TssA [Paracoccaceae bacterium]|nr:type VI secretion system protein TssA [Paracoccaceae bacterium]